MPWVPRYGPGDLIIESCQHPKGPPWADVREVCKKYKCELGCISGLRGGPYGDPYYYYKDCAGSLEDLCAMIRGAKGAPFDRIMIAGHCGGDLRGVIPGVWLGGDDRFDANCEDKCIKDALGKALKKGGRIEMCSCGYRSDGLEFWDQHLIYLAENYNVTVCACPTGAFLDFAYGCICVGGKQMICKSP